MGISANVAIRDKTRMSAFYFPHTVKTKGCRCLAASINIRIKLFFHAFVILTCICINTNAVTLVDEKRNAHIATNIQRS